MVSGSLGLRPLCDGIADMYLFSDICKNEYLGWGLSGDFFGLSFFSSLETPINIKSYLILFGHYFEKLE